MNAGRPREFDYDEALEQATQIFWRKGFEGTSMPDLTEAMGMNRPSIYAAFGNKEELFIKALDRYAEKAAAFARELLDAPTLRQSLEQFLMGTADSMACKKTPRGCLSVQGALVGSDESSGACKKTLQRREMIVGVLDERMQKAVKDGELPKTVNTKDLARFYTTVLQGMSVQSVSGLSCSELKAIATHALQALPTA